MPGCLLIITFAAYKKKTNRMEIRKALPEDLDVLVGIFDRARQFMHATGNGNQWINGYPSRELIEENIQSGHSYVCEEDGEIQGTFYFLQGDAPDPNYLKIYGGEWLNDRPYGVVHRIATAGRKKGVGQFCLDWCFRQCNNLRIDTHRDNRVMQSLLLKNGFHRCGIIYLANGSERIAFHKEGEFSA